MESEGNEPPSALTDEALGNRAARVRRRFRTARLDAMGRGFWEHWRPGDSSFLVGMYCTVVILLLEPSLWSDKWPDDLINFRIPGSVAFSLLLILPFNAWFLDRFLSSKTPGEDALPGWLRGLRLLALSPPLFSLYTISLWKGFLERRAPAERAASSRIARLDLSRSRWRLPSGFQSRVLYRSGFFFVWIAVSLIPVLVWAVWLAGARSLGWWHRPLIFGACTLLHLVACVSMVLYCRLEIEKSSLLGWRRALLLIVPLFWLFAIPGMVAGFAIFLFSSPPQSSLSWKIHASRTGVNRDPLWQGLQGRLQRQWGGMPWFTQWRRPMGLSRPEGPGREGAEIVALYRLKTLLLPLESAGLTVLIFRLPSLSAALNTAIRPALWIAVVLAGIGSMIHVVGLLARLFRVSTLGENLSRHPYGRYLLLTQTAFAAGVYGVMVLMQGSIEQFGLLLCLSAALCGTMTVLFFLLPAGASPKGPDLALWGLLYLVLAALGGLIALEGEGWRSSLLSFFAISVALSPVWSLVLGLGLGSWLLRPFSWRHVFDRRLPCGFRTTLAFATLTVTLPLGGLAVPLWIYTHHRLWPRYKPLIWKLKTKNKEGL